MSYVLYDVETTGLSSRFDQIVHFAAVRTDAELRIIDRVQLRCRLMPHIIPSPEAMHITGLGIAQLTDPTLPSHFAMISDLRRMLRSWCPSLFLGFNSLSFDEEFLRHAFYQCLHDPYLTNTQRSARADVLNICRLTAALRPETLRPAINDDGQPVFKLPLLAEANGIPMPRAHDAMADVLAMHALCDRIRVGAPDLWSQGVRFGQKRQVEDFLADEAAFLISTNIGNQHSTRIATCIGQHSDIAIRHYCLDLTADFASLRALSDEELVARCKTPERPIFTIRANAAPTLWALYDALPEHILPFDEAEVLARVGSLREDRSFVQRLRRAAQSAETVYPPSPHVEEQLYNSRSAPDEDKALMVEFHDSPWERRERLVRQFCDARYRRLSMRLIYFERPDLLSADQRLALDAQVIGRWKATSDTKPPWRTLNAARLEAEQLLQRGLDDDAEIRQRKLLEYLGGATDRISRPAMPA